MKELFQKVGFLVISCKDDLETRLGHADMTTTQQTYLHIIQELENKDTDKIMHHLAKL